MGILLRLSGDYPDSLQILSADRSIIREAYPAYPPQVWSKQRVYLYRIQPLITPPPSLLTVLGLMQTLFRRLNIMSLQIELQKNPALSPGRCPNSNLSILTIGTTMTHQICVEARRHTQVQRIGRRKPLSELLPNTTMQARDSKEWERRKRAPKTNFGCSICKIPFCRKDEC